MEGFSMDRVQGPLADKLRAELAGFYVDYVEINPGRMIMPQYYPKWAKAYRDFPVKKDDIWVFTYPKSGTTWSQEMAWCIVRGLDTEEGKLSLMTRFPFFEFDSLMPEDVEKEPGQADDDPCLPGNTWKILKSLPSPRTIKAHLHKPLLPKALWKVKPKIIYVCRDPRDVCVSYYFHSVKFDGYTGQMSDFVELFLADMLPWSPFWSHTLDFWKIRDSENILFLRFEEMKEDLPSIVKRMAKFLDRKVTEEEVAAIADHCSFNKMRDNKAVNNEDIMAAQNERAKDIKFMRKGKAGDWKNHLTKDQIKAFKEWTEKALKGTDFPYYQDYD